MPDPDTPSQCTSALALLKPRGNDAPHEILAGRAHIAARMSRMEQAGELIRPARGLN